MCKVALKRCPVLELQRPKDASGHTGVSIISVYKCYFIICFSLYHAMTALHCSKMLNVQHSSLVLCVSQPMYNVQRQEGKLKDFHFYFKPFFSTTFIKFLSGFTQTVKVYADDKQFHPLEGIIWKFKMGIGIIQNKWLYF